MYDDTAPGAERTNSGSISARIPREERAARRQQRKVRTRKFAALAAAVTVPAMAAPGEWQTSWSLGEPQELVQAAPQKMPFETAGLSFPGSAFYYLEDPQEAAYVLPALDPKQTDTVPAKLVESHDVGPKAQAFASAGTGLDKSRALRCLSLAIYYEAASESDAGQKAVAQVVLNRVAHPAYPGSVCGVVFQGSERKTGCQFSFTCDGSMNRQPGRRAWDKAQTIAMHALAGEVYAPIGLATHYHTNWVNPYWAPSLTYLGTIGAHRFYRFGGKAGAAATFRMAYSGAEPSASRHTPVALPAALTVDDPVAIARSFETSSTSLAARAAAAPVTKPASPAPAYTAELRARGGDAAFAAEKLPQAGAVKSEYANVGRWIAEPGKPKD